MSFDTRERSADDGRPVELFTFARDYQTWRYTSADRDVTADSQIFLARAITRSEIEASGENARNSISITAPRDLEVAELYRVASPTLAVTCVVQQYHEGDGQIFTLWTGRILSVNFEGLTARISLEPALTSIRRVGLRRLYQRQCPHVLYSEACGANREAFRVDGSVDAVAGLVVSVPEADAQPDGAFAGGYIEWEIALGIAERRFITDHTGAALTLTAPPQGLAVGAAVKLYPGCDHTIATCAAKFSNTLNYGGFPYMPTKNPFGGDPIY